MEAVPLCEPWPVSGCPDLSAHDPVITGVGAWAATEILWGASGRRFGTCTITVRPCARRCWEQSYGGWWWYPERWVGGWPYGPVSGGFLEAACGQCQGSCSCTAAPTMLLPMTAQAVDEVTIDGVVLPPSGYYLLRDGVTLVRRDGQEWPFCQDWAAQSGDGVFDVTARFGHPVPALGTLAMAELVPELIKACKGDKCKIPTNVLSGITRAGVSKQFRQKAAKEVQTWGLPLVERFLHMTNPSALTYGAKIWDPEEYLANRGGP